VREYGGEARHSYRFVPAAAANLSETQISRLRADPRVAYIEEDGMVHALDPELDSSWGVKHIGAGNVHPSNKGTGIKVAIIDTGIDYTHPDLDDNYKGGYDFRNNDDNPMDDHGHGTHCAGTIAAKDNGEGVIGVAPEAFIYGVKVLSSSGSGYLSDVVAGIEWAAENGMDIISMSLGTDYNYQTLQNACNQAAAAGVILVAAAGNDYSIRRGSERDTVDYPARYSSVIAVGATGNTDTKASFSSTGLALELAAPGVDIKSTYRGGGYAFGSGTSMACPHVAGTAALVLAGPGGNVRTILQDTADDLGDPGWDKWYGFGLVDAHEAAGVASEPPVLSTIEVSPSSVTLYVGQTQEFTATGKDQYGDPIGTGTITWESSNEAVGTVDQDGFFTALDVGDTTIKATGSGGVFGTAGVTVEEAAVLTTIDVSPSDVTLYVGETQQFTATGKDQYGDPIDTGTITWESSDEGVGTIGSTTGVFEAVGTGPTTVRATGSGGVFGTAGVTVEEAAVLTTIEVSPNSVTLYVGEIQQFTATGKDQYGDPIDTGTITWESSEPAIGAISSTGLCTALDVGDTAIKATGSGGVFGTAGVTVEEAAVLTTIEVSPSSVTLYVGETQQFTATGKDQYGDPIGTGTITWESSPEAVGTVGQDGYFTAMDVGDATITATGSGGVSGTASVTVEGAPSELTVFFDSFESSGDWTANWSQDSQNDWRRRTTRKVEGNYAAEVDGRATDAQLISIPIDLQGKNNATITFWWYIESGLDTGEYLAFDVSADGGAWLPAASLRGNVDPENTWHNVSIPVTAINDIMIRFRGTMSRSSEDAYVDAVRVIAW